MPTGTMGGAFLPKIPTGLPQPITIVTGDALLPPINGVYWLTKGSAAAITLAVPLPAQIGYETTIVAGTNFAHVVTATALLDNGTTAGPHNTFTAAAFVGSCIYLMVMPNLRYTVTGQTLGTVA